MKFTVTFVGKGGLAIYKEDMPSPGLGLLRLAREAARDSRFPTSRISGVIPNKLDDPTIELTEAQAEKSGLFEARGDIVVSVPPDSMGWGVFLRPSVGETITWRWEIDTKGIFDEWADAGFPLKWEDPEA